MGLRHQEGSLDRTALGSSLFPIRILPLPWSGSTHWRLDRILLFCGAFRFGSAVTQETLENLLKRDPGPENGPERTSALLLSENDRC